MRKHLSLTAATAAIALGLAGPAQAASTDYSVTTSAGGLSLAILGTNLLEIASTSASVDGTPTAKAEGVAASVGGTAVPGATSSIDIASGDATDGANCAAPALPDALAALVAVSGVCSTSTGAITGLPTARSEAGVGSIGIDPAALAQALADLVLAPITANLAPVFETVENAIDGDVMNQLEAACATAAVPLDAVQDVIENAPIIGGIITPVTGALPTNNACSVLVKFLADAPQLSDIDATLQALLDQIFAALLDLGVIEVSFNATSEVAAVGTTLTGASEFGTLSLTVPSLDVLDGVLDAVLEGPLGAFLGEIDTLIAGLGANAPTVPALADVIDQIVALLDLPLLNDPTPLVQLDVTGSAASVDIDTASGLITPTATAGSISLALSPTLADLLGAPQTTTVAPGDEVLLLAGTPLETRLAVGNATTDSVSARGEGVTAELFRATQGGIVLKVAETLASADVTVVLGVVETNVADPAPLPVTGGGAAFAGIATMAATMLRRRH